MSIEGKIKEGVGYIKEEMNEYGKDFESQCKVQEGWDFCNEGCVEDGKVLKISKFGIGY